jgi:hypothetical protein
VGVELVHVGWARWNRRPGCAQASGTHSWFFFGLITSLAVPFPFVICFFPWRGFPPPPTSHSPFCSTPIISEAAVSKQADSHQWYLEPERSFECSRSPCPFLQSRDIFLTLLAFLPPQLSTPWFVPVCVIVCVCVTGYVCVCNWVCLVVCG